jgi:hypothetical protein
MKALLALECGKNEFVVVFLAKSNQVTQGSAVP